MAEASNTTVTLQVHRFTPRPERAERARAVAARLPRKAPRSAAARIRRRAVVRAASSGCRSTRFPRALRILCWIVC